MRENFMVHVVDSDQAIADGLAVLLGTYGIDVVSYPDAGSFLEYGFARARRNCCLIIEADLPGLGGPALLRKLHEMRAEVPVIMLVSAPSPDALETVPGAGRVSVIRKPCLGRALIDRVLSLRAERSQQPRQTRRAVES